MEGSMTEEVFLQLKEKNHGNLHRVTEEAFRTYGRIVTGYDFSELMQYMEEETQIPQEGNCYVASVPQLENKKVCRLLENYVYGEMPVQVGYCNGRNSTYNGFEYHKCSEINIAVTDFILVLGHVWDVKNHTYDMEQAELFLVEKGTAIEMYQTTLHLSPCKVTDEGFKGIVVLARGTNTPLAEKPVSWKEQMRPQEEILLLQKNKWVIAHKDRKPLIDQGAYQGALGENKTVFY